MLDIDICMTIKQCCILLLYRCIFNPLYPPKKIPNTLLSNIGPHFMVKLKIKEKTHVLTYKNLGLLRNSGPFFTCLHVLPGHLSPYVK